MLWLFFYGVLMLSTTELLTDAFVRAELHHAFLIQGALPAKDRPRGLRLMYAQPQQAPSFQPTQADVTRMDRALDWLDCLSGESREVRMSVALRASGLTLREVAGEIGTISAPTVAKREARGIAVIVAHLRGFEILPGFTTIRRRRAA